MPQRGITVYLSRELELRIQRLAIEEHRSTSSMIAEAVRARFERRSGEASSGEAATGRQLGRIDARLEKIVGESLITKEIVLLFVRIWLEHNPPLDEKHEAAAAASAEARFERFIRYVATNLAPGSEALIDTLDAAAQGVHADTQSDR